MRQIIIDTIRHHVLNMRTDFTIWDLYQIPVDGDKLRALEATPQEIHHALQLLRCKSDGISRDHMKNIYTRNL